MPLRVVQTRVLGGSPSVRVVLAATGDVGVLVTTTGSVWLDGAAVAGPNLGLFLGPDEHWLQLTVSAADELWAYSSKDVTVTALIRSTP